LPSLRRYHSTTKVFKTIPEMMAFRRSLPSQKSVGCVPTMGALHEGHLDLIRRSKEENDTTVVSIFVNPTQFLPGEDLSRYPRPLEADLKKLSQVGVEAAFLPSNDEMYGQHHKTYVTVEGVDELSEGKIRPGHFRGVATIVTKLFNIVQPTRAYVGQKDALQAIVIQRLVRDLNMSPQVVVCPTRREDNGLAMSSRNVYLSPAERDRAAIVYKALHTAQVVYDAGARDVAQLLLAVNDVLKEEAQFTVQYISIASAETGEEVEGALEAEEKAVLSVAVRMSDPERSLRLIDNVVLGGRGQL